MTLEMSSTGKLHSLVTGFAVLVGHMLLSASEVLPLGMVMSKANRGKFGDLVSLNHLTPRAKRTFPLPARTTTK
jgi:hypothetical protein